VHVRRQIDFQAQQDAMPGHRDRVLAAVVRAACLTSAEPRAAVTGFPETSARMALAEMRSRMSSSKYLATTWPLASEGTCRGVECVLSGFRLDRFVEDPERTDDARIRVGQQGEGDPFTVREILQHGHRIVADGGQP